MEKENVFNTATNTAVHTTTAAATSSTFTALATRIRKILNAQIKLINREIK